MKIKSVAVYCSASNNIPEKYKDTAQEVGRLLAQKSIRLVCGGGDSGLMKIVSDSCMQAGGNVLGIMTEYLEQIEQLNLSVTELKIEKDMHARKKKMFLESDGFLVLPGGLGTLDEIFEVLTWKQIGLHDKPIVFFNQDGFWDLLTPLFDKMIAERTVPPEAKNLFCVVSKTPEILEHFQ